MPATPGRRFRNARENWHKWYKLKRWCGTEAGHYLDGLRGQVFMRDLFTCQRCRRLEFDTSLLVAHHKRAHRGNATLFWDPDNLTTVCSSCHSGPIQAEERKEYITGNWY